MAVKITPLVLVSVVAVVGFVALALMNGWMNSAVAQPPVTDPPVSDGPVQEISLSINGSQYVPNVITVRQNQTVRLVGNMANLAGCARAFRIPALGIQKVFSEGDNVLEFTPTRKGSFPFSCTMGMYTGTLNVI